MIPVLEAQEPDDSRWREIRALWVDVHEPPGEIKDTEPVEITEEVYQEEVG